MRPAAVLVGIVLAAASLFLSACGTPEQPHPVRADPRFLVLSAADLPGWQADAYNTRPLIKPRDMMGDSSDTSPYTDNGWVRAYEAEFVPSSTGEAERIAVLVSLFGDSADAKAFFLRGGQELPPGAQVLSDAPTLGERSKVYGQHVQTDDGILWYWFYWQDRNVFVRVLVKGPATAEGDAVRIAQREAQIVREH